MTDKMTEAREIIWVRTTKGAKQLSLYHHAKGYLQGLKDEREKADELWEYLNHKKSCISFLWEAGEPTENGGYRMKYAGKWYQSKPVDETPKCNCGFDEAITKYEETK